MPLNIIDISDYQAGLSISRTNADGAMIKTTQGNWYTSDAYLAQLKSAGTQAIGFYHFADLRGTVSQQGDRFIATVKPYLDGQHTLALDWEAQALTLGVAWAKAFLDYVSAKTGVKPLIYMSKSTANAYDWSSVAKTYGLWAAQYANYSPTSFQAKPWTDNNRFGAWGSPAMYQYTSSGRISGWGNNLDLSIFYGDRNAWNKFATLPAKKIAPAKFKVGDTIMVKATATKSRIGWDIAGWRGVKKTVLKVHAGHNSNSDYWYDLDNGWNDVLEQDTVPYQSQAFNKGDWVQLLPSATKETNGYDLSPRHNWIGQVANVTYIDTYSLSNYEYEVKWQNGMHNVHIAQQDLKLSSAPKPVAAVPETKPVTVQQPQTDPTVQSDNVNYAKQAISGLQSVIEALSKIK